MNWEKTPPFGFTSEKDLMSAYLAHCNIHLAPIKFNPTLSEQRILETFCAWKEDLNRSKGGSFRSEDISPDHIKSAAHLTYWLRRNAPIISMATIEDGMYSEDATLAMELDIDLNNVDSYTELSSEDEKNIKLLNGMSLAEFRENRERAFAYGTELFAFTFGFNLAKQYEEQKQKELGRSVEIKYPDGIYIEDLCYFFKFKSVSPHSIDLIYRALLKNLKS